MFSKKARSKIQIGKRERATDEDEVEKESDNEGTSLEDLIAFRKFKKGRQGLTIEFSASRGEMRQGDESGSRSGTLSTSSDRVYKSGDDQPSDEEGARARKAVRSNNFTQQTNTLDVDKHMMAYIEEQMRQRYQKTQNKDDANNQPFDPKEELYRITTTQKKQEIPVDEGNVTNSMKMLTAIPEVDLGMDTRLKNIEDTERAKRSAAEARLLSDRSRLKEDDYLGPARFATLRNKDSADQNATDEVVLERFKKRMRK